MGAVHPAKKGEFVEAFVPSAPVVWLGSLTQAPYDSPDFSRVIC